MPCKVSVRRILNLSNPVESPPWACDGLTPAMVERAYMDGRYLRDPVPDILAHNPQLHAERIAWLMTTGWSDAIEVDVGVPSLGYFPRWCVVDGNHRLYAAAVKGAREILITVSGSLAYASQRFGVPVALLEEEVR